MQVPYGRDERILIQTKLLMLKWRYGRPIL